MFRSTGIYVYLLCDVIVVFFFVWDCDHRDLHVLTHSFPTRRSSDLTIEARRRDFRQLLGELLEVFEEEHFGAEIDRGQFDRTAFERMRERQVREEAFLALGRQDRKSTRLNSSH